LLARFHLRQFVCEILDWYRMARMSGILVSAMP
jgi:hypothetical protein